MPRWIARPTIVAAAGDKPKQIEEFVGRVNSGDTLLSVARMARREASPTGANARISGSHAPAARRAARRAQPRYDDRPVRADDRHRTGELDPI